MTVVGCLLLTLHGGGCQASNLKGQRMHKKYVLVYPKV